MPLVIYADVLVVINLFVNYFLLLITKRLLRVSVRRLRILCGAALGGAYSLIIFAPEMPLAVTVLLHLCAVGVIVAVSIPVHTLKAYIKAYAAFFTVNFGFGGAMLAIWLLFRPNGMVYQNGAVYFDISIQVLLCSTVFCYALFSAVLWLVKRKAPDNRLFSVTLEYKGKSVSTKALLDTGNTLADGFSNTPVLVGSNHIVKRLAPVELQDFLNGEVPQTQSAWIRFIPYTTVDGSGMLRGFVLDRAVLPKEGIVVEKPILVQSRSDFDTTEYEVLLSNNFFERGENYCAVHPEKSHIQT